MEGEGGFFFVGEDDAELAEVGGVEFGVEDLAAPAGFESLEGDLDGGPFAFFGGEGGLESDAGKAVARGGAEPDFILTTVA